MTFLEFVCERLMGAPTYRSGGRSVWPCPDCGDTTAFSTLPPKEGFKDRVYCHRCQFRGDALDVLKHFGHSWPQRLDTLGEWQREYDQLLATAAIPSRGGRTTRGADLFNAVKQIRLELDEIECSPEYALQIVGIVLDACASYRVDVATACRVWKQSREEYVQAVSESNRIAEYLNGR